MKRAFKNIYENQYFKGLESLPVDHPGFFSFTICLILLSVQLFFIKPYFLVNDDIFKILLVRGIGVNTVPTPYFLYSSTLLGYGFMKCFACFPAYPWYGWFLVSVQFSSLWAFMWILCLSYQRWFHILSFLISCLGVLFIFFTYLQFTITASMAASSGVLLFVFSWEAFLEGRRYVAWFLSGILIWLSWLIRPDCFFLILLASIPLFIFKMNVGNFKQILRQQWKFVIVMGFLILLTASFDFVWFQKNENWKDFRRFAQEVQNLIDYQPSNYSSRTKPLYDSIGWSENDYWLFRNWFLSDTYKFNLGNFEKLRIQLPHLGSEGKPGSFQSLKDLFFSFWDQRIFFYFFIFFIFCRGKASWFLLAQMCWIILIILYLLYFMKATDRVTLPLLAYLMSLALLFSENPFFAGNRKKADIQALFPWGSVLLLCATLIYAIPNLMDYRIQNIEKQKMENQMENCLKQMRPRESQLFIMWAFPFELFGAFNNFDCFKPFHMVTTSFIQRSPPAMDTLKKYGIKNIFKDAVNNPNVLMICNREGGGHYYEYLKQNYSLKIYAQKVFDCGYFKVFSIHSTKGT